MYICHIKKTKKKSSALKSKRVRSIKNNKRCGGADWRYKCDVCGKRAICKCEGCYNFYKSVGERDEFGRLVYYGPRYCSKKCQVAHWTQKMSHKMACLKPDLDLIPGLDLKPDIDLQTRLNNAYVYAKLIEKDEGKKEYLLRNGAKPIVNAAEDGEIELVKRLLDNGVDVNTIDAQELTALSWAVRDGYVEMIKLLLSKKDVNVNVETYDRNTLLNAVIIGDKNGNPHTLLKDKERKL